MITVRFFGLLRLKTDDRTLTLEAKTIDELLKSINTVYPQISISELKNSQIFVNGENIVSKKLFKTKLNDNDEIHILSAAAGG